MKKTNIILLCVLLYNIIGSFEIYPNPFSEETTLNIDRSFKNAMLTMVNTFEQIEKQIKHISEQAIVLKRDNLSNGVYFITLAKNNEVIASKKLVITDK